ncbi:MAG: carbohydrate ABC transporter permease [Oscillospiraceae bacterium]|nr:carbohydrate ABC transporter permease [Oscillospiraceae bacterium]
MENRLKHGERSFHTIVNISMMLLALIVLAPFLLLFMSSVSSEQSLIAHGYRFWPGEFSLDAYLYISRNTQTIIRSYGLTVLTTVIGTGLGLTLTATLAYPLSRRDFSHRNVILFLVFFTMLFNGGLVPSYIMWTQFFGIRNTLAALIFPNLLLSAFNVILVKNYYQHSIPEEICEAAEIDGTGAWKTFSLIILPLSKPIFATIGMFYMLAYWNSWVNGLYYISDSKLFSLQVLLNNILQNIQFLVSNSNKAGASANVASIPGVSIRMAIAVLGVLPVMVLFPFFQRYFVKGITMGAVKG